MQKTLRKIPLLTLIIFALFTLTSCDGSGFNTASPHGELFATDDVTLSVKQDSLTSTGLVLLITNNTESTFSCDTVYYIEQKRNGAWFTSSEDNSFTAIGIILEPNSTSEFNIEWDGVLPKGEYRVVKPITINDETKHTGTLFNIY